MEIMTKMNRAFLWRREKRECQEWGGGTEIQRAPSLIKMGNSIKPAEMKSQANQGRKRAGGLLHIQDANGPETQPPPFTRGLTCQNTIGLPEWANTSSSPHSQNFSSTSSCHRSDSCSIPLLRADDLAPSVKWQHLQMPQDISKL